MNVAILGATRGMGRALARQLAARGDRIFVLGRDAEATAAVCKELSELGSSHDVDWAPCDLSDPATFAPALRAAADGMGGIDIIILTAGVFAVQSDLDSDPVRAHDLLRLNLADTIGFCEAARALLVGKGGGTLCVFSSVAGDLPRKPVAIYGAAKAGLSYYLDALDLIWRDAGLRVVTVKPGFVLTDMTAGLKPPPFAVGPEEAARAVVRGLDRGQRVIYAPPIWRWVMAALRRVPRFLFRRLSI
jgi:NAD(P)-dependent dehydrogenase (short-subunit alcohol dehydrogenase family)